MASAINAHVVDASFIARNTVVRLAPTAFAIWCPTGGPVCVGSVGPTRLADPLCGSMATQLLVETRPVVWYQQGWCQDGVWLQLFIGFSELVADPAVRPGPSAVRRGGGVSGFRAPGRAGRAKGLLSK